MNMFVKALVMGLVLTPVAFFSGCACKTKSDEHHHTAKHQKHKLEKMKHEYGGK